MAFGSVTLSALNRFVSSPPSALFSVASYLNFGPASVSVP
jgi:hypothetical protein